MSWTWYNGQDGAGEEHTLYAGATLTVVEVDVVVVDDDDELLLEVELVELVKLLELLELVELDQLVELVELAEELDDVVIELEMVLDVERLELAELVAPDAVVIVELKVELLMRLLLLLLLLVVDVVFVADKLRDTGAATFHIGCSGGDGTKISGMPTPSPPRSTPTTTKPSSNILSPVLFFILDKPFI